MSPVATFAAVEYDPQLTARLGSSVIDPRDAGRYHCHDLDYPIIRCFRTSHALDEAFGARAGDGAAPTAVAFVRVYEDAQFTGPSAILSQSYSQLGDIGWNDRITSYRGLNSGSGTFFKNNNFNGESDAFCCNQQVGNVGANFNDTFSSVSGSA